jgi:RNA polymerase sigma-70 factor (sigma-E family)
VSVTDYEVFARAHLPRLSRYAVMLTGDRELAADLVQDVLVKIFRQWPRIAVTDRPERYALRMVTNEYLSWRRRWAVRTIFPMADVPEHPHPDDAPTQHAARDDMWQRLATLPKRQRAVLVLRFYEQLPDSEIAELLGCSTGTVRGYAHRALASLRAGLAPDLLTKTEEI